MDFGKLVFTLPKEKAPDFPTYYGAIRPVEATGVVLPDGRVYLFDGAPLSSMQKILAAPPFNLAYEELKDISYPND